GVNIDAAATKDVDIDGGQILLTSAHNVADSIKLHADVGASSTIVLLNDEGTGTTAIHLDTTVGGITMAAADDITITLDATGTTEDLSILLTGNQTSSILIDSEGSDIDALSFTTSTNGGDIVISSNDKINMDSVGTFDLNVAADLLTIQVDTDGAGQDLKLVVDGDDDSSISLDSDGTAADAISIVASAAGGGITINSGTAGVTFSDDNLTNIGDISCDDIIDDTDGDIMYMVKTVVKTISANDDASADDFQFDDDAANSTAQNVDFGAILPAYAEIVSVQARCFETVGAGTFQVTVGTASAGAELLAQTTIDAANEIDGTATGNSPKLEASTNVKNVWVQGDPSGDWTAVGNGRWAIFVTYIDYGAAYTQKNP
ncbi:hypothetical protein LCGC14_2249950, partial [marine sediment metagenome]